MVGLAFGLGAAGAADELRNIEAEKQVALRGELEQRRFGLQERRFEAEMQASKATAVQKAKADLSKNLGAIEQRIVQVVTQGAQRGLPPERIAKIIEGLQQTAMTLVSTASAGGQLSQRDFAQELQAIQTAAEITPRPNEIAASEGQAEVAGARAGLDAIQSAPEDQQVQLAVKAGFGLAPEDQVRLEGQKAAARAAAQAQFRETPEQAAAKARAVREAEQEVDAAAIDAGLVKPTEQRRQLIESGMSEEEATAFQRTLQENKVTSVTSLRGKLLSQIEDRGTESLTANQLEALNIMMRLDFVDRGMMGLPIRPQDSRAEQGKTIGTNMLTDEVNRAAGVAEGDDAETMTEKWQAALAAGNISENQVLRIHREFLAKQSMTKSQADASLRRLGIEPGKL